MQGGEVVAIENGPLESVFLNAYRQMFKQPDIQVIAGPVENDVLVNMSEVSWVIFDSDNQIDI